MNNRCDSVSHLVDFLLVVLFLNSQENFASEVLLQLQFVLSFVPIFR